MIRRSAFFSIPAFATDNLIRSQRQGELGAVQATLSPQNTPAAALPRVPSQRTVVFAAAGPRSGAAVPVALTLETNHTLPATAAVVAGADVQHQRTHRRATVARQSLSAEELWYVFGSSARFVVCCYGLWLLGSTRQSSPLIDILLQFRVLRAAAQ